jgi:hypothetical protein
MGINIEIDLLKNKEEFGWEENMDYMIFIIEDVNSVLFHKA